MKKILFQILSKLWFRLYVEHLDYNCIFFNVWKDYDWSIVYMYHWRRRDISWYGYDPKFKDLRLFNII